MPRRGGERVVALWAALERAGCGALLLVAESGRDPDLVALAGEAHLGKALLIAPRGGAPRLGYFTPMERDEAAATGLELLWPEGLSTAPSDRPARGEPGEWTAAVRRGLDLCGVRPGPIALGGRGPAGALVELAAALEREGWSLRSGDRIMRLLRKGKTAAELERVRRAAAGACEAMLGVAEALASAEVVGEEIRIGGEPATAGRLRDGIARRLAARGLEQPEGNIVAVGDDCAVPHSRGDSRAPLRPGRTIVVDLFPRGGLFADLTRTFCLGAVPEEVRAAHEAVVAALAGARRGVRPGVTGWALQRRTCRLLAARGHAVPEKGEAPTSGYVHNLGHGVGLELHELPSFRPRQGPAGRLEAGDVFTLEPGLYSPERGYGVRLEDTLHLGSGGVELLTPLPYDLDPRRWG